MRSALVLAGHTSTQLPQPVQSSGETCTRNFRPASSLPLPSTLTNPAGASAASCASSRNGRMVACGQTSEHWLHWMQFSGIHSGTSTAMPRFSYRVVPVGTVPSAERRETGSLSPSCARMGWMKLVKYGSSVTRMGVAPSVASAQEAG